MSGNLHISLAGEEFVLLPQRAVYRPSLQQLIISDLHLGKASHFRKQGIAMPQQSHLKDIDKLNYLLHRWQPHTVILLGDLFHSSYNREWLWFKALLNEHQHIQFVLVEGNHDVLGEDEYAIPNLAVTTHIAEDRFLWTHHPVMEQGRINLCGHVHPGIRLTGLARQSLSFPCFYHKGPQFLLPAFGELTGFALIEPSENDTCYIIANNKVIEV